MREIADDRKITEMLAHQTGGWMDAHFGSWDMQVPLLLPKSAAQTETLDSDIEERCRPTYTLYISAGTLQLNNRRLIGCLK